MNRGWRPGAWLGILLFAACGWVSPESAPSEQELGLLGCAEVRRPGECLIERDRKEPTAITLLVKAPPHAEVRVLSAGRPLLLQCGEDERAMRSCPARGRETRLVISVSGPARLRVVSELSWPRRPRLIPLAIGLREPDPEWLQRAAELNYRDELGAAAALVRQGLARTGHRDPVRARALSRLGNVLIEQFKLDEADQQLAEAARLDAQAGALLSLAGDLFRRADILFDRRRSEEIAHLFQGYDDLFVHLPEQRAWYLYYQALSLRARGRIEDAEAQVREAEQIGCLGCASSVALKAMLAVLRAGLLTDLGRPGTADRAVAEAALLAGAPCRQGYVLGRQAELRVQVLESLLMDGEEPGAEELARLRELWQAWEDKSPAPPPDHELLAGHTGRILELLWRSRKALEAHCSQPRHIAKMVLFPQARLHLMTGQVQAAARTLQAAREVLRPMVDDPAGNPAFQLEWHALAGRLARAEHHYELALEHADRLLLLTHGDDTYEARLDAHAQRALALMGLSPPRRDEAIAALKDAQRELEERSLATPLLGGRSSYLGRFEWTGRLLLSLILRVEGGVVGGSEEELAAALSFIRHARTRALAQFQPLRGAQGRPQRPPAPGELLLTCHPLPKGWVCLAAWPWAGRVHLKAAVLPEILDREAQARLLGEFAEGIRQVDSVTVLGFGAFREVPVHLLEFDGRALGEQRRVRYSLDLHAQEGDRPPAASGESVFVINGYLEQYNQVRITAPLRALIPTSWRPLFLDTDRDTPGGQLLPPLKIALEQHLPDAAQLFVLAHASSALDAGISTGPPWGRFTVADILGLRAVPPRVVLIVCDGGNGGDETGGQEGLALAHAFLLRGSREVLSTTRRVSMKAAAALSLRLYQRLAAGEADLLRALTDTLAASRGDPERTALRYFVP